MHNLLIPYDSERKYLDTIICIKTKKTTTCDRDIQRKMRNYMGLIAYHLTV